MIPVYCFKKSDLKFVDMQQITTKLNMPLFIDKNNNVIIRNSMKDLFNDCDYIQCCVINDCSQFYKDAIIDFEKAVALENDKNRLHFISHEFIDYISKENEKMSNIELIKIVEKRCISETQFIKPKPYNFKKAKKGAKQNDEQENYLDLFVLLND